MLPVQRILIKSTEKEKLKSRLINGANHAVIYVACTATEIEALKKQTIYSRASHIGFIATSALKQSKSFELAYIL